ncbi:MAG: hypothetical protein HDR80_10150 [Bacteroides sp.]|nr:hypothetical protein [Bacteroides sp.]MBD5371482.1 hypothetical protein [Bacteroides sp.]
MSLNPTRGPIPAYSIAALLAAFFIRPLFYLAFYLYLCFAKDIKRRFPKAERRFGPSGWVWTGLTEAFLGVGIYESTYKMRYAVRKEELPFLR